LELSCVSQPKKNILVFQFLIAGNISLSYQCNGASSLQVTITQQNGRDNLICTSLLVGIFIYWLCDLCIGNQRLKGYGSFEKDAATLKFPSTAAASGFD
jgi:hypothetical protein